MRFPTGLALEFTLLAALCPGGAMAQPGTDSPRRGVEVPPVKLAVDEVVLTFHATDAAGHPVGDLKPEEIRVWDNGRPPRRILAFEALRDRALRGALLLDTSESMQPVLSREQALAVQAVQSIFTGSSDQMLVGDFAYGSETARSWTADHPSLLGTIRSIRTRRMNAMPGTSLFDAIFRTCFGAMGSLDPTGTGNFILLFSDGEDNASRTSADEALTACQRSNTAIYAFHATPPPDRDAGGAAKLRHLAERSGGKVFDADESRDEVARDLERLAIEMRNQYRLVYSPAALLHDGSFHSIVLEPPDRVQRIEVRSGYYAPGS